MTVKPTRTPPRPRLVVRTGAVALTGLLLAGGLAATAHADQWRDDQYWLEEYGFTEAWETTEGEGITIAVIDTGVDSSHPDLTEQFAGGTDVSTLGASDGTQPLGVDPDHGTMVASLIAGHGNNLEEIAKAEEFNEELARAEEEAEDEDEDSDDDADESPSPSPTPRDVPDPGPGDHGILGVAPAAQLLSVSVYLGDDPAAPTPEEQIPQAVKWAVDNGADVINISLSSSAQDWPLSWDEAFLYAEENDVVVVAAAGNRGSGTMTVGAPATIPGVLTVAGLDQNGAASWDSSTEGITIGVAAPADPLVGALPDGGYRRWAGTSGAAPIVAGLAALIRSEYPDMPAHQVIHRILETAHDAGDAGIDPVYGHGIIDAAAAVNADVATVDRNPMDSISEWIRVHRRAEVEPPETSNSPVPPSASPDTSVPTEVPVAADVTDPRAGIQPAVLFSAGGLALVLAVVALVLLLRSRRTTS
ncbi:S8 family peptidase [Citricoccus muralis]|uniref:S8 family serine peptidase n=1 Tax=Citricoccus muralis TaxID=169134 RepID=A0ABY8H879_9MICC|nr:S8 family serine peptidase [Citricoccus muralis]WFP17362.1 S8 family serine peptidase [Citricoccus muralis]